MALHLSDLPARFRTAVAARAVAAEAAPLVRVRRARPGRGSWVCMGPGCGEVFSAWAPAQRHAHDQGHYRIECGGVAGIVADV